MQNSLKISLVLGLFFAIYCVCEWGEDRGRYGIRINWTSSVPYTLFLSRPYAGDLQKGDYVSFFHPRSGVPLVKQVGGMPGDQIESTGGHILVSGVDCGAIQESDKVRPIEFRAVPVGRLYLQSSHPESFDSRYAEFGLISMTDIQERLWPIF